jgi:dimethylaniline monooxygenase (N-oxide forming)
MREAGIGGGADTFPGIDPMKRFAVIGAGAAGLCAAKHLLARGVDVTVYEAGSRVGGLWVYNNDNGMSPAYKSLHINSEANVSTFTDFPFPPGTSLFPDHAEMSRYFEAYARHFDLIRRIRFKCRVASIEADGSCFCVTPEGGSAEIFDGVVVATGHQSSPRHPPQIADFAGEYTHAHSYRVPQPYEGKRVLVIGPGNSGVDIAADICTLTAHTSLSARSPVLIMPRMAFGAPVARTLMKLEKPWLPLKVRLWIRATLARIFHGRMEQWGFRTPKGRSHPISHPTLISHIVWGRISVRPGLKSVAGREVTFTDGTTQTFDTIIAATGYTTELPFLTTALNPISPDHSRVDLYNRVVDPACPGLFFVGFFDVTGGSNVRMMDDQSEYVSAIATGAIKLPDPAAMRESIATEKAWAAAQFPNTPRYGLELDPRRYRKILSAIYAKNNVERLPQVPVTVTSPVSAIASQST